MKSNNFIYIIKGVSGSGKSTRVFQFMKYLRDKLGYELVPFFFGNEEDNNDVIAESFFHAPPKAKKRKIGYMVKEINTLFLGNIYFRGKLESFQGFDTVTATFGGSQGVSEFLERLLMKHSIIFEGAGVTQSNRFRPRYLYETVPSLSKVCIQYYNFKAGDLETYNNRVTLRSGKIPSKGTMWLKNKSFTKEFVFSKEEQKAFPDKECFVYQDLYDEPVEDFGVKLIENFLPEMSVEDYTAYTAEKNYVDENKFENW